MNPRLGDDTDDYCTHCHRLTNHTVAALVGEAMAQTACRTCGFQHDYKGGHAPARVPKAQATAFDQVLAGILGPAGEVASAAPARKPKKRR